MDPVTLDPTLRQASPQGRSARLVAFPFDLAVAFFARSRAAVFSFTIVADETRVARWRWSESECREEA